MKKTAGIFIIKIIELIAGLIVFDCGITLGIISKLGQTTSTGTSSALSIAAGIPVGNAMGIIYSFFLLLQFVILRKKFRLSSLTQLIPVFFNTVILNYFKYDFEPFQSLAPAGILTKIIVFAFGTVFISLGFAIIKCSEFLIFPPEGFCSVIADLTHIRFGTVKLFLDFLYIAATLLICFIADISIDMVGVGTVVFALCNGPLINFYMPGLTRLFRFCENRVNIELFY